MTAKICGILAEKACKAKTVMDLFSGSGVVANAFKQAGFSVIANDNLYFAFALLRGSLVLKRPPEFKGLRAKGITNPLDWLTAQDGAIPDRKFIFENYSPNANCQRMYFQNENALKIDFIRTTIENWHEQALITEDEYFYLLAALINAVPYVSNIAGIYAAYLKHWDKRTYNSLQLKEPEIFKGAKCRVFCGDAAQVARHARADAAYLDPPYNGRQYLPNYHVLETIARYDDPEIFGITGMRKYERQKSDFCKVDKAAAAFKNLLGSLDVEYIMISYNTEGLLQRDELAEIVCAYGDRKTFELFEFDQRRYKSKIPNRQSGLKELLYFIKRN